RLLSTLFPYTTLFRSLREMAGQMDPHLQNFRIYKSELGNPFSEADGKTYEVSIAHTKYNVFCGLSRARAIGIDMEPADRKVTNRDRKSTRLNSSHVSI